MHVRIAVASRPSPKLLSLVIPLFNEEEVFQALRKRLSEFLQSLDGAAEVILVNDGSRDCTQACLEAWAAEDKRIKGLCFARNFGHQIAVTGLEHTSGDAIVILDAELQDPPEVIHEMLLCYQEGYDLVYGQRAERVEETVFKRATAFFFCRLMRLLIHPDLPVDAGDFRLMSRQVVDALLQMHERHRFLRGMVAWLGFANRMPKSYS